MNYHTNQNRPKSRLISILCLVLFVLSFSPLFAEYLYLFDPISGKWLPAQMDSNGCLKTSASVSMASASVPVDMSPTNSAIASTTAQVKALFDGWNNRTWGGASTPLYFTATGAYRGSPDAPIYNIATGTIQTSITNSATQPFYMISTGTVPGSVNATCNLEFATATSIIDANGREKTCNLATQSRVISEARIPVSLASGTGQLVGTILTAWSVTLAEPQTVTIVCDIGNIWVGLATTTATSICASQGIKLSAGMSYSVDYGTGWTAGLLADTGETAQASATIVVSTRH